MISALIIAMHVITISDTLYLISSHIWLFKLGSCNTFLKHRVHITINQCAFTMQKVYILSNMKYVWKMPMVLRSNWFI